MSLGTVIRACALVAILAAPLGACGKLGELERPGPLNGAGRATTREADEVQKNRQDPSRPVDTIDSRDQTTSPRPVRTLPIGGSGQDPSAAPPASGTLPDPYNNPRS